MNAPRIRSLIALSSATSSQSFSSGTWITSPGLAGDAGQVEALADEQAELAQEPVRAVDGDHPVLLAVGPGRSRPTRTR